MARCTVERLMRELGLHGARRGRKVRTTVRDDGHQRAADLLRRDSLAQPEPPLGRRLHPSGHLATWAGVVYVAFVVDIFSRPVVGWAAATSKRTRLVLDALDTALMESAIGRYKTELIKPGGPWKNLTGVELATAEYADWYNTTRLHGEIGHHVRIGDGCSAMAGLAGQSLPSMMRKSRSKPSGRATSAF
ncbi:integrase core domain-containing protein [Spirillospora sp. NPDC000708]